MRHRIVAFGFVASFALRSALALLPSYSPFGPEENRSLHLPVCDFSRQVAGGTDDWEGTVDFSQGPVRLSLHVQTFGIDEVRVFEGPAPAGTPLPVALDLATYGDVREPAVCADLNADGHVDFAVTIWKHGNGLGMLFFQRLVGLSTTGGYRFWIMETMEPSPEDFVTFGDRAPIAIISTAFVQSGTSDYAGPGQRHSYLAYDLWTFRGGDIVSANAIDARFPKYVQMTYNENHKPSVRMSSKRTSVAGRPPKLLGAVEQR